MESDSLNWGNSQSFQSQNTYPKYSTSAEIKEIKLMLLSGDKDRILLSVEKIKAFVTDEESLEGLIKSDISEFLCDAVIPFDESIVRAVHSCLEIITKNVEFYTQSHSCFVTESLLRSIHFLLKSSHNVTNLSLCLQLIISIIEGYITFNVEPEKKTIENILQLLPHLLESNITTVNEKFQMGQLIKNLLDVNMLFWTQQMYEEVLMNASFWLDMLNGILDTMVPIFDKLIALGCMLCSSVLRSVAFKNVFGNDNASPNLRNDLICTISNILVNHGASYFSGLSLSIIENYPSKMECFFQALLDFYNEKIISQKRNISHRLSEGEFFQFITNVISFSDVARGQNLQKICIQVLSHIIITLSEDVFQLSEIWFSSCSNFYTEVQQGFSKLPLDASQWLDVLINPNSPKSSKLALLLYLYFYCMTAKSQSILKTIYPAIVTFIKNSNGIESSPLLIKVVWFIFVISQLSAYRNEAPHKETESVEKIVAFLETKDDLSLFYTHHPAILYWTFSSKLKCTIQTKIVHLWLQNKSPDCKELDALIVNSPDVRFAVLDILKNGCGQVLDSAFLSLKSVISVSQDDTLPSSIWYILPQVLAKHATSSSLETTPNVDYVVELSSLKTPSSLDITKVIRIASLLPEVLVKSDLLSVVPSLNLMYQLFQVGFKMNDHRVRCAFLRFNGLIQKIIGKMNTNTPNISVISLKILTLLWREYKESPKYEKFNKIKISKEAFIDIFENSSFETVPAALDFLQEALLTSFKSLIFEIKDVDYNFVAIMFLKIENLCIKDIPGTLSKCWLCLKYFLLLHPTCEDWSAQIELATDPLLHEVINFHLSSLKNSREMKEFCILWMNQNNAHVNDCCFPRKIFGGFYSETVRKIGNALEKDFSEDDRILYEKVLQSGYVPQKDEIGMK